MIGVQCQWWFVEDTLEHLRVHFKFFVVDGSMANWHFSWIFALWSLFQVEFERVINGLGGQKPLRAQSKYGLMGSRAKIRKIFIRGLQEWITSTFLGPKHESAIWDRAPPHLHIKPSLYVYRRAQGSQIFKQNWIISICLRQVYCNFSELFFGVMAAA